MIMNEKELSEEFSNYFLAGSFSSYRHLVTHAFFARNADSAYISQIFRLPQDSLKILKQVHSNRVHVIIDDGEVISNIEADALVTDRAGIIIGVRTADCTPILFLDPNALVIGVAHAGWKGAFSGIIENTIEAMVTLGAKKSSIITAIGPCIRQDNYAVGPDFYKNFKDLPVDANAFIKMIEGRTCFDLPGYCKQVLRHNDVCSTDDLELDTYSNTIFNSYRRSTHEANGGNPQNGHQISAIAINHSSL